MSQIKRRLADAYLGQGKYDLARQNADEALIVAEKIGERVEIAACYVVYGQLATIDGQKSTARQWFAKALDIYSMTGSRYELASTRYQAAASGIYQNGEQKALLYLARDYFVSEEVSHYVRKVDRELKKLPPGRPPRGNGHPPEVVAASPVMVRLVELARNVAASEMAVLLTGPTGTGKDLLAEYIHYHSGAAGRFVTVNCAAMPEHLTESELFGYRKGAFTGANSDKAGLVETAAGGTLYLNEIAETTAAFQAKLLDVLERRMVRRLGETEDRPVVFRLIAATNREVEQMVRENRFRADLYHRLNQIRIELPPLSDRPEDIPALVSHFLTAAGVKIDNGNLLNSLIMVLTSHSWSGNVRQLKSALERLVLLSEKDLDRMVVLASHPQSLSDREQLLEILRQTDWNRREAARRLGVSEGAIRYQIKKYQIHRRRD